MMKAIEAISIPALGFYYIENKLAKIHANGQMYVPERTCRFKGAPGKPPTCSACGFEAGIYDCDWSKYVYSGKYCSNCGARVVK